MWQTQQGNVRPIEAIYEKHTCGLDSDDLINIPAKNKVLSNAIKEDVQHDSFAELKS